MRQCQNPTFNYHPVAEGALSKFGGRQVRIDFHRFVGYIDNPIVFQFFGCLYPNKKIFFREAILCLRSSHKIIAAHQN